MRIRMTRMIVMTMMMMMMMMMVMNIILLVQNNPRCPFERTLRTEGPFWYHLPNGCWMELCWSTDQMECLKPKWNIGMDEKTRHPAPTMEGSLSTPSATFLAQWPNDLPTQRSQQLNMTHDIYTHIHITYQSITEMTIGHTHLNRRR